MLMTAKQEQILDAIRDLIEELMDEVPVEKENLVRQFRSECDYLNDKLI